MATIPEVRGDVEYNCACADRSIQLYNEALKRSLFPERKLFLVRTLQAAFGTPFRCLGCALSVAGTAIGIIFAPCAGEGRRLGTLAYRFIWIILSPFKLALNMASIVIRISSVAIGVLLPCLAIRGLKLVEQMDWLEYQIDAALTAKCLPESASEKILRELDPDNAKWYLDTELATNLYKFTTDYKITNPTWKEKLVVEIEMLLKEIIDKKWTDQAKILGVVTTTPLPPGAHPCYDDTTHQIVTQICSNGVIDPKEFRKINLEKLLGHFKVLSEYVKGVLNPKPDDDAGLSPWQKGIIKALEGLPARSLQEFDKLLDKSLKQINSIQACVTDFGGVYVLQPPMPVAKT